jgi:hypothetical protein
LVQIAWAYWSFEKSPPRQVRRDPFEAEFFTGDDDEDRESSRTDSLVREVIQNSLDASRNEGPVRVRFAVDLARQRTPQERAHLYLSRLVDHLDALGNEKVNRRVGVPEMDFLLIEDFGTHGLTGEPSRNDDPPVGAAGLPESFYWFWRNIGRSGKQGLNRGRWGLGKTVFPSSSRINAFFGLTIRSDDRRPLLMGQAITKIHKLGDTEYLPEAFFHDPTHSDAELIQMPFEAAAVIDQFRHDFQLERKDEPGLSVVIPYPIGRFSSADLIRSVVLHFFVPILQGLLEVEVVGEEGTRVLLDHRSITDQASRINWNGSPRKKLHRMPPFELARWAIARQRSNDLTLLCLAGAAGVPQWGEDLFPRGLVDQLRQQIDRGDAIALRVPMTIEKKDGGRVESHFDVFLQRNSEGSRSDDYFVRGGMTISGITSLSGIRGVLGLVLVDHSELSTLLGDTEGPAHTEWGTGETRPEERYVRWKRRVTFVRNSVAKLFGLLSPPPKGLLEDLLRDIFSIEVPSPGRPSRSNRPGARTPGDPGPIPPAPPRPFTLVQDAGGFRVSNTDQKPPERIRVRVAYDMPKGNPLSMWSHFDFIFDDGRASPIRFQSRGARIENRKDNEFEIAPDEPIFEVEVSGFDLKRDLFCRAEDLGDRE